MRGVTSHRAMRPFSRLLQKRIHTLQSACEVEGVGLHSGVTARVRLSPALTAHGIQFVRTDLPGAPAIAAEPSSVVSTVMSTAIGVADAHVATIEHLMAALYATKVTACIIEVNTAELPLLDGSAKEWVSAIKQAGLVRLADAPVAAPPVLSAPVRVEEAESWAFALPSPSFRLTVGIDFASHAPIGRQWASWSPPENDVGADVMSLAGAGSFADEVAPARTFTLAEHVPALREAGLIKGGSLDNALVCDTQRWINGPLRFENEPARHKLLDLAGDLALLGARMPNVHVVAFRSSHRLNVKLARAIESASIELSPLDGQLSGGNSQCDVG